MTPASPASRSSEEVYKNLDNLDLKGWVIGVPTVSDSLTQDAGGWRSTLASAGFGLYLYSLNLMSYDLAQAGSAAHLTGAQQYNGQRFTYQTGYQSGVLTYDLSHLGIGLDGGQIAVLANVSTNSYAARDGLRGARLKGISWYQPILHGKVDLQMGLISNQTEYMGTYVGGDLAGGALGPQASISVESGLSYSQYAAPTFSARIHWTRSLYTRTAIQRSISPAGSTVENNENSLGLTFTVANAKPLVIQEIGYRIRSAPGVKSFWARVDGVYNWSDYKAYVTGQYRHNHYVYMAVDRQLTQPDPGAPMRGIYMGGTYTSGASAVDLIDRYGEIRAYWVGPFAGRPHDSFSLVATVNRYSPDALRATQISTFHPYSNTQSYSASYKFQIMHGLYMQPGIDLVAHPVYTRNVGTAVNGVLNIVAFI